MSPFPSRTNRGADMRINFGCVYFFSEILMKQASMIFPMDKHSKHSKRKSEICLQPKSRIKSFIICFICDLVFCGSAIFLWHKALPLSLSSFRPIVLCISCTLFGLVFLFFSIYLFMELLNPSVCVTLMPSQIEAGKTGVITWEIEGRIERLKQLDILIECRKEKALFDKNRGRVNTPDSIKLYHEALITVSDFSEIQKGEIGFLIGPEQPITFKGDEHNICWYVIIKGSIKRWADIRDEFEFEVVGNLPTSC